jgi:two-component system, NtrC family, response regulator HydG
VKGFSTSVAELLVQYHWPGNVRELENVMERAVALANGSRVEIDDLPPELFDKKKMAMKTKKTAF